jgi:hypothetical protein
MLSYRASGINTIDLLQPSIKEDGYCYIHITSGATAKYEDNCGCGQITPMQNAGGLQQD